MVNDQIRQAHRDLLALYQEICTEVDALDDATLKKFLGKFNSAALRRQVREHGDGYTLRSVPRHVEELLEADELVLIVMNSPLLNQESVFDPHTSLDEIPYWRDKKSLLSEVSLPDGALRKLQFLVWEQDYPVHGALNRWGRSDNSARANKRLLCEQLPSLNVLIPEQKRESERLLLACKDWLADQDRKLIVLTNKDRSRSVPPISQLRGDLTVSHLCVPDLFRPNRNIMDRLIEHISGK